MTFSAKIFADSINPLDSRLTTMELTYPRCIHSEFMTHRMFSRNAASSRAIPVKKMLRNIEENPFIPLVWGLNQKGMQAGGDHRDCKLCEKRWLYARDKALVSAEELNMMGLHKQIVNRIVEPWMWITVIVSGNEGAWENFYKLRCHKDAEPHIQKIAYMTREIYDENAPCKLGWGEDHLPLVGYNGDEELTKQEKKEVSTARCARVSYLTHEGQRDVKADLKLHNRLAESGHWSPFEHVAEANDDGLREGGNFGNGWQQYRKTFASEFCRKAPRPEVINT